MPVTKTAKRALRVSMRKREVNVKLSRRLEIAMRKSRKSKLEKDVREVMRLADRASKSHIIHKNKASRIKSSVSKLLFKKTK